MISEAEKRAHLFLFGCITTRFFIAYLAYKFASTPTKTSQHNLKLLANISLLIGVSFWSLYLFHLRQDAPEAGGVTWWNSLRPVHGSLWLLAGYMMHQPNLQNYAYIILLIDTLLGLERWVHQRI